MKDEKSTKYIMNTVVFLLHFIVYITRQTNIDELLFEYIYMVKLAVKHPNMYANIHSHTDRDTYTHT